MMLAQELDQHRVRRVRVARADAHRTEEESILRILRHERADAAPEQQQRVVTLLILEPNEGATELQRRCAETSEQPLVVLEQRSCVQPANADIAGDAVRPADSIGADDLPFFRIPREEVEVRAIERIEIDSLPGPLTDGAECDRPQPPDLPQRRWNGVGGGAEDPQRAALDQARVVGKPCDFIRDLVLRANRHANRPAALLQQLATE